MTIQSAFITALATVVAALIAIIAPHFNWKSSLLKDMEIIERASNLATSSEDVKIIEKMKETVFSKIENKAKPKARLWSAWDYCFIFFGGVFFNIVSMLICGTLSWDLFGMSVLACLAVCCVCLLIDYMRMKCHG